MNISEIEVLVLEDDKNEMEYISQLLAKRGIKKKCIKITPEAHDIVEIIKVHEPHIILINLHLINSKEQIDGILLLKKIHDLGLSNTEYNPFIVAVSTQMHPNSEKIIRKYSSMYIGKQQRDYPDIILQRYAVEKDIDLKLNIASKTGFSYKRKVYKLIYEQLLPFGLSNVNKNHQKYLIEFIYLIIPTIGESKRKFNATDSYNAIAVKYENENPNTVKTAITRAYKFNFAIANDFFDLYSDDILLPKQKDFYIHIAQLVKDKL